MIVVAFDRSHSTKLCLDVWGLSSAMVLNSWHNRPHSPKREIQILPEDGEPLPIRGGVIENCRTRNLLTLWTAPVLRVHVRVWVHLLGDPQKSVQLKNATATTTTAAQLNCHIFLDLHLTSLPLTSQNKEVLRQCVAGYYCIRVAGVQTQPAYVGLYSWQAAWVGG